MSKGLKTISIWLLVSLIDLSSCKARRSGSSVKNEVKVFRPNIATLKICSTSEAQNSLQNQCLKFANGSNEFSLDMALIMAYLSQAAYLDAIPGRKADDLTQIIGTNFFKQIKYFSYDVNQGLIFIAPEDVVIIFRGTDSLSDALVDGTVTLTQNLFYGGHFGFFNALDSQGIVETKELNFATSRTGKERLTSLVSQHSSVRTVISNLMRNSEYKGKRFWLGGHSLGGALATIAGGLLAIEQLKVTGIYTFGAPRALNSESALKYPSIVTRNVHRFSLEQDVVPALPLISQGFRHTGMNHHMVSGSAFSSCPIVARDEVNLYEPNYQEGASELITIFKHETTLAMHSMNKYIECLEGNFFVQTR